MTDALKIAIMEESSARNRGKGLGRDRCPICERKGGQAPGCRANPMAVEAVAEVIVRARGGEGRSPLTSDRRAACEILISFRNGLPSS